MVRAAADPRRLEGHPHRQSLRALDVVLHLLPRRKLRGKGEAVLSREELPVEEIVERAAAYGAELRARQETEFGTERPRRHRLDANHRTFPDRTSRTLSVLRRNLNAGWKFREPLNITYGAR